MNSIMLAIGAIFRTPFAIIGLLLATIWGICYALFWLLVGLLWIFTGLPLSFIGAAMGGTKRGRSPSERFRESRASAVRDWQYHMKDAFGVHPDLCRWWARGHASAR